MSPSTYWYIHSAMLGSHNISFLFFPVHMVCIFTTSTMLTSITHNLLFVYIMYLLHMFMHFSEKAMAPHSSTLTWKISWMEEPGRLQSIRLHFHFSLSCSGEGNGNPLQCSCLENPRDGGAWWAAVYGVMQSWTRLKWLSSGRIHF